MKFDIAPQAEFVLQRLIQSGFEAYLVGGCVRDLAMGKTPHDWDIATSALPQQVIDCFTGGTVIKTGIQHGTVTVLQNHCPIEVTTFRVDGAYLDNRHPTKVTFTPSLKEDMRRRDFTINAMAYEKSNGIYDVFGGLEDLKNKVIRCVGDANQRFTEDALRIMRALRFASQLGFEIETETKLAMHTNKHLICQIAMERVSKEFCLCLLGEHMKIVLQDNCHILSVFLPELEEVKKNTVSWNNMLKTIESLPFDLVLRWAALCYAMIKVGALENEPAKIKHLLQRLKLDTRTIRQIEILLCYSDAKLQCDEIAIKQILREIGPMALTQLLTLKGTQYQAQNDIEKQNDILRIKKIQENILQSGQCYLLKDLEVTGKDIISLGVSQGTQVGKILSGLLELVIEGGLANRKADLMNKAKDIIRKKETL